MGGGLGGLVSMFGFINSSLSSSVYLIPNRVDGIECLPTTL